MKCKNELEYITQIVNDHLATLPPSSKVVVAREAQTCIQNIAAVLNPPAETSGTTPAAPVTAPTGAAAPAAPVVAAPSTDTAIG